MAEQLDADLNLDVSSALDAVDALGPAIEQQFESATGTFSELMANAVGAVPPVELDADAAAIEPAIEGAVTAADANVEVTSTGEEDITGSIDSAVTAADANVAVEADTSAAEAAIGSLSADDISASVDLDTANAQGELEQLSTFDIPPIEIEADTSNAQAAIDDLGSSAIDAGSGLQQGASGAHDFGAAAGVAGGLAGAAAGDVGSLGGAASSFGGTAAGVVGVAGALGAGIGLIGNAGIESLGALQRFDATLGQFAGSVENVNVGSLKGDLDDLAVSLGTDDEAMRQASATNFQFAKNSGASGEASSRFTSEINALALRAVALNPALGSAADVAETMSARLARGGRFAASFGLSLTAAEINARALADTGKTVASDLTLYEKSAAAAAIATDRYGASLAGDIKTGTENAVIQQRRLGEEINNVIEKAGRKIAIPLLDLIEAGIPVVAAFAEALGTLGESALPLISSAFAVITPVLESFSNGVGFIADSMEVLGPAAVILGAGLLVVSGGFQAAAVAAIDFTIALSTNPIFLAAAAVAVLGAAIGIFGGHEESATQKVKGFHDALLAANGVLDEHATKVLRDTLVGDGLLHNLTASGVSFQQYSSSILSASDATDKHVKQAQRFLDVQSLGNFSTQQFVSVLSSLSPALGATAQQLASSGQLTDTLATSMLAQALAAHDVKSTTDDMNATGATDVQIKGSQATATNQLASAQDLLTAATNAYKAALDAVTGVQLTVAQAEVQAGTAKQSLITALAQQVDATHNAEQVELGRLSALTQGVSAEQGLAAAIYQSTLAHGTEAEATLAANTVMHDYAVTIRDQLTAAYGDNAPAAQAMLDKLGLTPFLADPATLAISATGQSAQEMAAKTTEGAGIFELGMLQIDSGAKIHMGNAANTVESEGGRAAGAATNLAGEASSGWGTNMGRIPPATQDHMGNAVAAVVSGGGQAAGAAGAAGANTANTWGAGVSTIPAKSAEATSGAGPAISGAAPDVFAAGYGTGASFGSGVLAGMNAFIGPIATEAAALVTAAKNAADAAAGAKSPSKLFAELGENLALGVAVGLDASGGDVTSAAAAMIQAAHAAATPAQPPAGFGVDFDARAIGRAFASELSDRGDGVQVIVVRSMEEAKRLIPAGAARHPAFLDGRE